MTFQNIFFDMDGTLVDSAEDVFFCLNFAYRAVLGNETIPMTRNHIGPPLAEMIRAITPHLTHEQVDATVKSFRACYDASPLERTVPYPGVMELLSRLERQGKSFFIVTNKPKAPVLKILKNLELTCFRDMMTPDIFPGTHLNKTKMISLLIEKWSLKPDETLIVGDAPSDVESGKVNQLRTAALLNGYGDEKALRQSSPDFLFEDMTELAKKLFLDKETRE